jgi:hypothetical protein
MYRTAYIVQNTHHDFEPVKRIASRIEFLTNGYEEEYRLFETIRQGLEDFDSKQDILVPVGNVLSNVIAGAVMCTKNCGYWLALFRDKEYHTVYMMNGVYKNEEESLPSKSHKDGSL